MNNFQKFKALHTQKNPLHIGNVWDVNSTIMLENNGYKALGTSSAAIAASLGYEDGEQMSFNEMFLIIKAIKNKTTLPLTVDLEAGYSRDKDDIFKNILHLHELGIVGINLEDSIVKNGKRTIIDANEFSETLRFIKDHLAKNNSDIFLNIRTDFYIMSLEHPLKETLTRSKLYEKSGADGLFVPCVADEYDIKNIVENTSLPVNIMAVPNLPTFSKLQQLGVKRISSGPFLYNAVNKYFSDTLEAIDTHQSFMPLFE